MLFYFNPINLSNRYILKLLFVKGKLPAKITLSSRALRTFHSVQIMWKNEWMPFKIETIGLKVRYIYIFAFASNDPIHQELLIDITSLLDFVTTYVISTECIICLLQN